MPRLDHTSVGGRTAPDIDLTAHDHHATPTEGIDRLSRRQSEVLALLARGMTNATIADTLFIAEKSVVEHVSKIYDLLDLPAAAHRRVLAALCFLASGPQESSEFGPSRAA